MQSDIHLQDDKNMSLKTTMICMMNIQAAAAKAFLSFEPP